jgi:surfactin synthase thioesterase subunit
MSRQAVGYPEIVALAPDRPTLNILAIPHAGAGVAALYPLSVALRPHGVAVHVVRLPGRETRIDEPAPASMGELLDALVPLAVPLGPSVLFGHSTGALVAYLLAQRLTATASPPLHLVASGRRAPHLPSGHPPIHRRDDAGFLAGIEELAGEPVPDLHDPELWEIAEPALRADIRLDEEFEYVDAPPLPCPVTALRGESAQNVSPEELHAWERHTDASFTVRLVPGGHFYPLTHPAELAGVLV